MAGPHSKLTRELIERACEYKSLGMMDKDICAALDISQSAFYRWIKDGGKTPLEKELCASLKKCEADKKKAILNSILSQGEEDWRALGWYLERVYPSEYGRVDRLQAEVNAKHDATVELKHVFEYGDDEGEGGADD